jgi:hypothetical protein
MRNFFLKFLGNCVKNDSPRCRAAGYRWSAKELFYRGVYYHFLLVLSIQTAAELAAAGSNTPPHANKVKAH